MLQVLKYLIPFVLFSSVAALAEEKIEIGSFVNSITFKYHGEYEVEGKHFIIANYEQNALLNDKKTELTDSELKALVWFSAKMCEGNISEQNIAVITEQNPNKKYHWIRIDIRWGNDIAGNVNNSGRIFSRVYRIENYMCNSKVQYNEQ